MIDWAYLPEEPTSASATKIDIDIMILTTDRLFDERLFHHDAIDNDSVSVFSQCYFGCHSVLAQSDAKSTFHKLNYFFLYLRTTVARNFYSPRHRNLQVIESYTYKSTIPKQGLRREVIDAERITKFHVGYGFIQRKVSRKERN